MPELPTRIAPLRQHLGGRWTPARQERVWKQIEQQGKPRSLTLTLSLAAGVMATCFGVLLLWGAPWNWNAFHNNAANEVAASGTPNAAGQRFIDGSLMIPTLKGTEFETLRDDGQSTQVRLKAGVARFQVEHRGPARPFQVLAKSVLVQVVGTVFTVAVEPGGVRVAVEGGVVRVRDAALNESGKSRELHAGDQAFFPDSQGTIQPVVAEPAAPTVAPALSPLPVTSASPSPDPSAAPDSGVNEGITPEELTLQPTQQKGVVWRGLAQQGDYRAALVALDREGPAAVRDDPKDLLLAADSARLGGRPDRATHWLDQVVRRHGRSSMAPLAAFTLGRVLLEQLGRPAEAARAFVSAQRLAPGGALAEDALAREVESWSRAGDPATAHQRGEEYQRRYPHGRRIKAVRAHAGLEEDEALPELDAVDGG